MADRNHPVRQLLDMAAMGQTPSDAELDAIAELGGSKYPGAKLRREVAEIAHRIVELRRDGENGRARREARAAASATIDKLPEVIPPPQTLPDSPRELAALARGETVPEGKFDPRDVARRVPRDF